MSATALKIGWIGAGRMGAQLIVRLLDAGYEVSVYNRTASKVAHLAERGARVVGTPVELADRDVVFAMVSTSRDLEAVMLGEGGLLTGASSPRVIADASTVSAEASAVIREAANARGSDFLATPVSGNPKVIAAGKLTVAVSGPREVFDSIEPVLNVFGRAVTYVGDGEVARLVKIAHNVMLGVVTQCLAEITVLVEKGGVSRADFLAFLNDSVMGSIFTQYKTPAFVNLDFTPTFTMDLLQKDFDLGLQAANTLNAPMPIASATRQIVAQAAGAGRGLDEDFATLLLEVARGAGLDLTPENVTIDDGLTPAVRS
ncbi:NAD(P)-dependent oxidoreductase [Mycolicibacterium sp.]|uniref:NAD(P)-dependent oxidoreductase n=1 Tax=Mycolicibacterium sp. TaxID=2320850 RepID=UPI003D10A35D